jgi:hypothetical protein
LDFLLFAKPYQLADAEGGSAYLSTDAATLERGKTVFAENCMTCHSSVQPEDASFDAANPSTWYTEERKAFFRNLVADPDFLNKNFLSDDRRYPVTIIGTNVGRAFGTNAIAGHVWQEYSSIDYQNLPPVPEVRLDLPFLPGGGITITNAPGGGRGYYRTASLINLWTSAPFLHNNGLGLYNGRFDVAGRMEAFSDAADKLLHPEKRDHTVLRTSQTLYLREGLPLPLPVVAGIPITLLANVGARLAANQIGVSGLGGLLANPSALLGDVTNVSALLFNQFRELLNATDVVEDKGHTFGSDLSEDDKAALIEFMKRF